MSRHFSKRELAKCIAKETWSKLTGHDGTHCVLVDGSQGIGIKKHGNSWFQIVYSAPDNDAERDTVTLHVEFRASAVQQEWFTSADLDVVFTHKEAHHDLFVWHHKPMDEIRILEVHPLERAGKSTTVHYQHDRQASATVGFNHDPVQGNFDWKQGTQHEFAYTTQSTVKGFGAGTSHAAWSFQENRAVKDGIEGHYELKVKLNTNLKQHPIHMKFFAQARMSSGHVLDIGTNEVPKCVLLSPPGQQVTTNPTEAALMAIGRCAQTVVMSPSVA